MEPFKKHTGVAVPFDQTDVNTDLIIPARYLKRIERTGYGQFLFYSKRFLADGSPNPEFVLNQPQYREGTVLVAGRNFGCGSSREHAPWALQDYGFKVVIAPSFADIFANNAAQNGLLTIDGFGHTDAFEVDAFKKHCLLNGLDAVGLTLRQEAEIARFERGRPAWMPRVSP
jgi:3-isopropylmalate/(R)-2-methylmalate dehydratase small subunit